MNPEQAATAVYDPAQAIAFDNVAVSVTDLDRAVEWWSRVFGFTP